MVWDFPTRAFHWLLLFAVAGAWFSGDNEIWEWHARFGTAVLGLIVFRIIWGFCGHAPSRFAQFLVGWQALRTYVVSLIASAKSRSHAPWFTHNPLGGLSVLALLGVLLMQTTSGLFSESDALFAGPFAIYFPILTEAAQEVHQLGAELIMFLVALHLAAIIAHRWLFGETLVTRMWRGGDAVSHAANLPPPTPQRTRLGVFLMLVCLGASSSLLWL